MTDVSSVVFLKCACVCACLVLLREAPAQSFARGGIRYFSSPLGVVAIYTAARTGLQLSTRPPWHLSG